MTEQCRETCQDSSRISRPQALAAIPSASQAHAAVEAIKEQAATSLISTHTFCSLL